jgi:hypothetical protein
LLLLLVKVGESVDHRVRLAALALMLPDRIVKVGSAPIVK